MFAWQETVHESVLTMRPSGASRLASTKVFPPEDFLPLAKNALSPPLDATAQKNNRFLRATYVLTRNGHCTRQLLSRTASHRDIDHHRLTNDRLPLETAPPHNVVNRSFAKIV